VDSVLREILPVNNPELAEMCAYILRSGGKRIRPAVCVLSHKACGGQNDKVIDIAAAFEVIHNATLIHDDINDNSEIRRGAKTLHVRHTVSKAIVTGDLLFAMGFKLMSTSAPDVIDAVVAASVAMADSEFLQKDHEHSPAVSEDDYMGIIRGKTAMPIFASARIGAVMAGADAELTDAVSKYAMNTGMAFQIIDDLLDVTGDMNATGKTVGSDILEGKPTLPMIYAMQDPVHGKRIREIMVLSRGEIGGSEVSEALDLIKKTDAVNRCISKAEGFVSEAVDALGPVPDSEYKRSMVGLSRFVMERDR
jgi:geranylgeranyl pyrophosphate synthase